MTFSFLTERFFKNLSVLTFPFREGFYIKAVTSTAPCPPRAKGVKRNPNLSERLKVHALARAGVAGLVPLEIYFNQSLCLQSKLI